MLSDDSELTDLSLLEGNHTKSTTTNANKSTAGKQKRDGYRLRNVLKPGRTTQYTAKALFDQIHQNDIELDPEYQRDVVWSDAKQIGLIDSIFRNFYVPPIIFSVTTEDDGTEKRVCIDGKQRLTSIQKFIGGLIPHRDPFTNEKLWFVDSQSGPKRKLLPPHYRSLFQNKQIVCIEYSDLPGDLEREVFQRVQMGMALTTAEKLQAISGPWPDLVREIMRQYHTGKDGITNNMDLEQSRARDFQNVAQSLFCIDHLPDHAHGTPLQLERWLQKEDGPSDFIRTKIHEVFRIYKELANHPQLKAPFKKPIRVAPAEFIMTAVLIAVYKNTFSLSQLSQAIGILRARTRQEHADIRTNAKVYRTMYDVISKDLKSSALKDTIKSPISKTSKFTKRKRDESAGEDSSDEDREEYKPKSTKKRNAPTQPANVSTPHSSKPVPSAPSKVKTEDTSTIPVVVAARHSPRTAPSSATSGLDKIRAAKLQVAEIFGGTQPAPSTSLVSNIAPSSLPTRPLPPAPVLPNASLEAMMMSQTSSSTHPTAPYSLSANTVTPALSASHNGVPAPPGQIPIPVDGMNYPQYQDDYSRASRSSDGHRRYDPPRPFREEHHEGMHHGRSVYYDDRRDHDPDRAYKDREWDRDRDRDRSNSRGSYSSRGEPYYKPRDKTSDWRLSGHKDR